MDNRNLFILLLLLPLIFLAHSASLFTYSFPYDGSNPQLNSRYSPSYQLGTLSLNYSITIRITVTNTATSQLPLLVSSLSLKFVDSTNRSALVDAVNADGSPYIFPAAFDTTYTATYKISFPPTYTLPSAAFILFVAQSLAIRSYFKLDYYNIEVTSFLTNQGISVGNKNTVSTVLKATDIIRDGTVKVIYVSQPNQVFSFTTFPASYFEYSSGSAVSLDMFQLTLYSVNAPSFQSQGFTSNDLSLTPLISLTSTERTQAMASNTQVQYTGNIAHYSYLFPASGFYLVQFQIIVPTAFTAAITFHSDTYACPYSIDYPDYNSNFQPCSSSAPLNANNGPPCIGYDAVTRLCALCVTGYILKDGQCLANTTCPQRKYYNYGSCLSVSQTCGDYDYFTGNCVSCRNASYTVKNGSCIDATVKCGARQWKSNNTCLNVSQTCITFDSNNGSCLSCNNSSYQLKSNGSCVLITVTVCPQGSYLSNKTCVPVASQCFKFNYNISQCQLCVYGYLLQKGVCLAIVCPPRQFLPLYGVECVDVSQTCGDYDKLSGNCLNCRNPGYSLRNGACIQVTSPLAGCKQRERLGFGPCVGADLNCKVFNLLSGNCQTCKPQYYLDYTGHCVKTANCSAGWMSINGQCMQMPNNCLQVNELGFCTRCANSSYRIIQGQCVYYLICKKQQYLNNMGECKNVSPTCATWNPSNGLCITCKTPEAQPHAGICCPYGRIFYLDSCVDIITLQNTKKAQNDAHCFARHPSLGFCLHCQDGFAPVYSPPYGCIYTQ